MLYIRPLKTIQEALQVALIRNECCHMMTNNHNHIIPSEQKKWFESFYLNQNPIQYRIWLLQECQLDPKTIIGYFAVKEDTTGYYITEGLLESKRGHGGGSHLLKNLLNPEIFKNKPIFADIFTHNLASIRLHQKFQFKMHKKINNEITRFVLEDLPC